MNAIAADDPPFASPQLKTILVVEDNVMSRVAVSGPLRDAGYKVIEAASDAEARSILRALPVDLLFLDLHLPSNAEGLATARYARSTRPAVAIIFTSSRLEDRDAQEIESLGSFVPKPYLISRVLDLVQSSLAPPET